jgi:ATP dependent DNA ligase-like protein
MTVVTREDLPCFVQPMLLRGGTIPRDDEWALEVKWDGMRAQVRLDGRTLMIRSRPGRDCTHEFPELEEFVGALSRRRRVLLDGEIACLDSKGRPDFSLLRSRLRARDQRAIRAARERAPATLMLFDVLHLDGRSTRCLSYRAGWAAQCAGCGADLPPSRGSRPRKWCSESCRGQHRVRLPALAPDGSVAELDEVLRLLSRAARAGVVTASPLSCGGNSANPPADESGNPFAELDGCVVPLRRSER